jgi:hypothetical protein
VQTALRALGTLIHHASLATQLSMEQVREICNGLCTLLETDGSKNEAIMTVWCISVMELPHWPVERLLESLLAKLRLLDSPSFQYQALAALAKLLAKGGAAMRSPERLLAWLPPLYTRLLSPHVRVREKAETMVREEAQAGALPEAVARRVTEDLQAGLLAQLQEALLVPGQELPVVKAWSLFVLLAGAPLWQKNVINAALRVPQQSFMHESPAVRTESHRAWRCLVENFARLASGLEPREAERRLRLLRTPLRACLTKPEPLAGVRLACLHTWLALLATLAPLPRLFASTLDPTLLDLLELFLTDPDESVRRGSFELLEALLARPGESPEPPASLAILQPDQYRLLHAALPAAPFLHDRLDRFLPFIHRACSSAAPLPRVRFSHSRSIPCVRVCVCANADACRTLWSASGAGCWPASRTRTCRAACTSSLTLSKVLVSRALCRWLHSRTGSAAHGAGGVPGGGARSGGGAGDQVRAAGGLVEPGTAVTLAPRPAALLHHLSLASGNVLLFLLLGPSLRVPQLQHADLTKQLDYLDTLLAQGTQSYESVFVSYTRSCLLSRSCPPLFFFTSAQYDFVGQVAECLEVLRPADLQLQVCPQRFWCRSEPYSGYLQPGVLSQ